jgi:hypothetical protein
MFGRRPRGTSHTGGFRHASACCTSSTRSRPTSAKTRTEVQASRASDARSPPVCRDGPRREAGDADLFRGKVEVCLQEINEVARHCWIGVGELELIPLLRALGPVQHAACDEPGLVDTCTSSTFLLKGFALRTPPCGQLRPTAQLTVVSGVTFKKGKLLRLSQLDVAHPKADRRLRNGESPRDLVDRRTLFRTYLPCELPFACFHIGKRSCSAGRAKRAARIELAYPGWKPGALPLSYARERRIA